MSQLLMRRSDLEELPTLAEPPEGYKLRAFRAGDEAELAVLMSRVYESKWTTERTRAEFLENPRVPITFLVMYDGRPVATASALIDRQGDPDLGWLHWVAVDSAHRGRQLGRLVSLAVLYYMRDADCHESRLRTDDFRLAAISTYLGLGYQPFHDAPDHAERWSQVLEQLKRPVPASA